MTGHRAWRVAALGAVALGAIPLFAGCSARLDQMAAIAADGGGNITVELRLDQAAQDAINLPAQLRAGTFDQFLTSTGERWSAPGAPGLTFREVRQPDGTVVLTSVHRLRAGAGDLADLRSAFATKRSLQPILNATGRYWAAPVADDGTPTTATQMAGAGEPQSRVTGLPASVTLQTLLASEFTPARVDRNKQKNLPTFTVASRGGVGDVLDPTCDALANRNVKTRADKALGAGLIFRNTWAMPTDILEASEGAALAAGNATATWTMAYGECPLMELSSAGADDGRFVNGLILGGVLLFLLIVFGWRSIMKRRGVGSAQA